MGPLLHRYLSSGVVYEKLSPNHTETLALYSDDECEPQQRAAKRRRIERIATQYIHGTTPLILSAALRGPLDKSWGNPWARNTAFDGSNPANRAERLRDEIIRRRARDKAERSERRRMQEIEMSHRATELRKDGLGKSAAQSVELTVEAYGRIDSEKYHSKVQHSTTKIHNDPNYKNRTSRREENLARPIAQDVEPQPDPNTVQKLRTERDINQWLRRPRDSKKYPEVNLEYTVGVGGEQLSDGRLMPSNKAGFTSINCQSSITAPDSILGRKLTVFNNDEENWLSLQEAKRLSQRAVEEALAPIPERNARYTDLSITEGYQSAKRLSRRAAELALAAADGDDNDLSPLKAEVQHSAERCAKTKTSKTKTKTSGTIRGTKKAEMQGQEMKASKEENLDRVRRDHLNDFSNEISTRSLKHPHLASPTPASSLGFAYRKIGMKGTQLDQPLLAINSKVNEEQKAPQKAPQKRRPRLMTFESSPASIRTSERNIDDKTAHCVDGETLNEKMKIQLPDGGEPTASTDYHAEVINERQAIVVEDGLAAQSTYRPCEQVSGPSIPDRQDPNAYSLSSRNLSTQAAMIMARREFQEEFGSSTHEINSLPEGHTSTPLAKVNSMDVTTITPFHTFNTGPENLAVNPNTHVEMPMSTQDLFNAASPFTLSTAKKKWHRLSFTSLHVEAREGFEIVDGKDVKLHFSEDGRKRVRTIENDDNAVEKSNPSRTGGRCEDSSSGAVRSSAQSLLLTNRSPLKERNVGTSFHNSSNSQPKSSRSQVTTFSITPSGSLKEVSYQDGQRLLADIDLNAELDFAGSFLQSWETNSLIRK